MSTGHSSTQPIPIASPSNESQPVQSPTSSALSASLKAFSDLSLANRPPVKLESDEFKQAYHHARRASFGNGNGSSTRPISITEEPKHAPPGLSTSPGSNVSDLSSLPTPSSSPPASNSTSANPLSPSSANSSLKRSVSNGGNGNGKTAAVPILGGVCEKEEIEALENGELEVLDDEPLRAPAHHHSRSFSHAEGSALFGGGAKWGWPASGAGGGSGTNSPPSLRRASIAFTSPPGGSSNLALPAPSSSASTAKHSPPLPPTQTDPFARMQPLGRVVSAGASLQTPHDGKSGTSDGLGGLFRRFSIGGFGSKKRPQPPSPPSLALPPRESNMTAPESAPAMIAQQDANARGRTLGSTGSVAAKPKRKLSPMGEKFLRGGY